jgi:hypothetical protein
MEIARPWRSTERFFLDTNVVLCALGDDEPKGMFTQRPARTVKENQELRRRTGHVPRPQSFDYPAVRNKTSGHKQNVRDGVPYPVPLVSGTGLSWRLDGKALGSALRVHIAPTPGRHHLSLLNAEGKEVDALDFEMRGAR